MVCPEYSSALLSSYSHSMATEMQGIDLYIIYIQFLTDP